MARTPATPTSRLEQDMRRRVSEFEALQTLASRGRIPATEVALEATELATFAHAHYQAGHEPFRALAAEWAANVAKLNYLTANPPVGSEKGPKPFVEAAETAPAETPPATK